MIREKPKASSLNCWRCFVGFYLYFEDIISVSYSTIQQLGQISWPCLAS